ncbi:MAG: glycosyltransferase [Verrucomicrobiota bacterium]|nr:glycosyltransferase [Limisphaera sp.]MDW8381624.1 glycosyltransferase [Verrucomicrobiota bacterium]
MRFLMLNWRDPENPEAGGAERVSLAFMRALAARGHEVFWFSNRFPGASPAYVRNGIHFIRAGTIGTSILAAWKWYRQQPLFDLVIDQHHGIPWYAPWWCGTRCLGYIHEVLGPIWHVFYPGLLGWIGRWQERWTHWLYRNVPFWVPSASTLRALRAHGVKHVSWLPNGCDTVPLAELEPKPLTPPVRLVTVSRLAPNKRVDHAILALARLRARGVPAQLTVVGGGAMATFLKHLTHQLQLHAHVRFTGPVDECGKNQELQRAHFLVHTSVREGWGLNVIEANAMGTPAVVYPVDGLVDSTVHGETGWVVGQETPDALAEVVWRVCQHPDEYANCRRRAWERSKRFQWSEVLPKVSLWLEAWARGDRAVADQIVSSFSAQP